MIKICLFASLRDAVGQGELEWPLEASTTAREVFRRLSRQYPALDRHEAVIRIAVNQEYSHWDATVRPGDEVAFFPPVSGGAA